MEEPNPELEPDVPDWSNEPKSDDVLAEQLQERGVNMSEVMEPDSEAPEAPEEADPSVPAPPDSPGVPAPDTSPPEEGESENGGEEDDSA